MKKAVFFCTITATIILTGCFGVSTDNPEKAFRYWTGIPLPDNAVTPLNGRYRESGHFSSEYIVYLKMVATTGWTKELIELNNLEIDTIPVRSFSVTSNLQVPSWFVPPSQYNIYKKPDSYSSSLPDFVLYVDSESDTIYIFNYQF